MARTVIDYASPPRDPRGKVLLRRGAILIVLAFLLMFLAIWYDDLTDSFQDRFSTVCFWAFLPTAWIGLWVAFEGWLLLRAR